MIRSSDSQQKKGTCQRLNFDVPEEHEIRFKESKKRDKNLTLCKELKKRWNKRVTVIPIVIGALGTVTKELVKGLEDMEIKGQVDNIQSRALLKSAIILRRVLETWGDLLLSKL